MAGRPGRPPKIAPHGAQQLLLLRPLLVSICDGDYCAALMLSAALNWSTPRPFIHDAKRDGEQQRECPQRLSEFAATSLQWQIVTGLTRGQQEAARQHLCDLALWSIEKRGMPARIFYRVNWPAIEAAVLALESSGGHA